MLNIEYNHITLEKSKYSEQIVVKGEIVNMTNKDYNALATRIIVFIKDYPSINTVLVTNGLRSGATKTFEKYIEGFNYDEVFKDITHTEIYAEEAY